MIEDATAAATRRQTARDADGRPGGTSVPGFGVTLAGTVLIALTMRESVAGVPPVLADLGLDPEHASILVTIPVVSFSLGALAGPWLRSRLGIERALFAIVAALLFGLVLRAIWPTWGLFPGTVVAALAIALLNVLLPSLVRQRFPDRIGFAMGAYTVAMTLGASLAAGLTVPVFRASGGSINAALGIWAIPAALALLAWVPQVWDRAARAHAAPSRPRHAIWREPLAWHVLLFMGMQSLLFYGPLSWLPQIYRDRGMDAVEAGFLLMLFTVLGILGNLAAPVLASRFPDQRVAVGFTISLTFLGILGVLAAPDWTALLWIVLMGVSQGSSISIALMLIVLRAGDAETAAELSSMAQFGGYLIGAAGPLVMGLLHTATGGWAAPLLFLLLIGALIWIPGLIVGQNRQIGVPEPAA